MTQQPPPPPRHRVPDLSADSDEPDVFFPGESHDSRDSGEPGHPSTRSGVLIGWSAALLLAAVAVIVAIWQVNERLYTPEATAEHYWEALGSGDGTSALGFLSAAPDFTAEPDMDHVLLSGEPLMRSSELIDSAELTSNEESAQLSFTVGSENFSTELPLVQTGSTWGFFDEWRVTPGGIAWFEIEVPGAPQGGIGQVQVNGEPVNLDQETTSLSAFIPTAAHIEVDSQWLVGSVQHVVTYPEDSETSAERVTIDLEASEAAAELLHAEIQEYFDLCADQQVLMPANCPVGATTNHRVDAETIRWDFPEPEEVSLSFDADGWNVTYESLTATVAYDAVHYHSGEQLTETEEMPFDLDIRVGASGEDLLISVAGQ